MEQVLLFVLGLTRILLAVCIGSWVVFSPCLLGAFATNLLFYPNKDQPEVYAIDGLAPQVINFKSHAGKPLNAWFFHKPGADRVVVLSHGNAGNISHRGYQAQRFLQKNVSVFLYDYQGYGASPGSPSTTGVEEDGLGAFDYVTTELGYKPEQVIVYGESLGCAVSSHIAITRKPGAVILQSGFASLPDIAKVHFLPFRLYPNFMFLPSRLSNVENVQQIQVPLLVMHGKLDETIPFTHGEAVFAAAHGPKTFVEFPNSGHNDILQNDSDKYDEALVDFLKSLPELSKQKAA